MVQQGRIRWTWAAQLMLAAIAVANAGCLVAAVGAAAGAAGVAYYEGEFSRSYPATPADVHAAAVKSLTELQLPIALDEPKADGGKIESYHDKDKIIIALSLSNSSNAAEGPQTEVGIRVGTFGDKGLSMRILDQISFHLVSPGVVPAPPPLGPPQPQSSSAPPQTAPPPLAK